MHRTNGIAVRHHQRFLRHVVVVDESTDLQGLPAHLNLGVRYSELGEVEALN